MIFKKASKVLLPSGFRDLLPPDAEREADSNRQLMDLFSSFGYQRVKPPLIEFEETLVSGAGISTSQETFRVMDPISQTMLGIRTDITVQVARIANGSMVNSPRPLRLCYSGEIIRVTENQLRPERQLCQTGLELVGSESVAADVEVIKLGVESLKLLGVEDVTVCMTIPTLIPKIIEKFNFSKKLISELNVALERKDLSAIKPLVGNAYPVFKKLITSVGLFSEVSESLRAIEIPAEARKELISLIESATALQKVISGAQIVIDPVEKKGFEYQCGVSFSFLAKRSKRELGFGGRYMTGLDQEDSKKPEPSTGLTFFMDTILDVLPKKNDPKTLYVPFGTPDKEFKRYLNSEWRIIRGLTKEKDINSEAKKLNCSYILKNNKTTAIS